jgi:hypothetical protein
MEERYGRWKKGKAGSLRTRREMRNRMELKSLEVD